MTGTATAEQGFLNTIRDEPMVAFNRLAYADWLEEHGRDGEAGT